MINNYIVIFYLHVVIRNMLIHTVLFWLKQNQSDKNRESFLDEVKKLGEIASVDDFHVGSPAATPKRPVVVDNYDFAITVVLKDMKAHDDYQADPIHLGFIEKCKDMWEKVVIYDAD